MIGTMIRQLVDQGLTSLRELETVTDRGTSTIYRWMNGESEPHCSDLQKLVKRLSNAEARRTVLGFLTSDLPVHLCWFDADDVILYGEEPTEGGQDVLSKSLEALDDLSEVLKREHDAIRRQDLSPEGYTELVKTDGRRDLCGDDEPQRARAVRADGQAGGAAIDPAPGVRVLQVPEQGQGQGQGQRAIGVVRHAQPAATRSGPT